MRLEVYDKYTREIIDIVKKSKYSTYNKKFCGVGTFEIKVPYNEPSLYCLSEGNYIYFEDDVVGIIKYWDKETSDEFADVTIKGYLVEKILEYRSFLLTTNYTGSIASTATRMVNDLLISSNDRRRNIDFIKVSANIPDSESVKVQKTGDKLNVALEDILSTLGYGYSLVPEISTKEDGTKMNSLEFNVIKPANRTIGNNEGNTPVVFSLEMNNLSNMSYEQDSTQYCSVAIVAGEGEGVNRKIAESGDIEAEGIDRIELYVDARDLQSGQKSSEFDPDEYYDKEEIDDKIKDIEIHSVSANVVKTGTTATITITDGKGTTTATVSDGKDGEKGDTGPQGQKGDVGPQGPTGSQGPQGNPGTNGKDGKGIVSIIKTSTSGLVDTYTITYTDSTTSTFQVTNGKDGGGGQGTSNYNDLNNLPKINNVELKGNMSLSSLGIQTYTQGTGIKIVDGVISLDLPIAEDNSF